MLDCSNTTFYRCGVSFRRFSSKIKFFSTLFRDPNRIVSSYPPALCCTWPSEVLLPSIPMVGLSCMNKFHFIIKNSLTINASDNKLFICLQAIESCCPLPSIGIRNTSVMEIVSQSLDHIFNHKSQLYFLYIKSSISQLRGVARGGG